jgi:predicted transcriptional regulator
MAKKVGKNVSVEVKDGILYLAVNLKDNHGDSKTGKSVVVASTEGNVRLDDGTMIGLNVYRPKAKAA